MSATLERVNSYRYLRIYRVKTEIHDKILQGYVTARIPNSCVYWTMQRSEIDCCFAFQDGKPRNLWR